MFSSWLWTTEEVDGRIREYWSDLAARAHRAGGILERALIDGILCRVASKLYVLVVSK